MPYARAISAVGYIAPTMSRLVAELYGKGPPADRWQPASN
jgi:hypothetical protein